MIIFLIVAKMIGFNAKKLSLPANYSLTDDSTNIKNVVIIQLMSSIMLFKPVPVIFVVF